MQVLWSLGRAGAERMVLDLSVLLKKKGFRVVVIAAGGGGEMERDFKQAGLETVIGPAVSSWRRLSTQNFLKKQITYFNPDLVHAHLSEIWVSRALQSLKSKTPWIVTAHNDDRDDPWLHHIARGKAFRQAKRVVCVSEAVERYIKAEFHVPANHVSVIRNGIDLNMPIPRLGRSFHRPARFITIGRLTAQKDHATLFSALHQIKTPWILDVLGSGPAAAKLKQLAHELDLDAKIHFWGTVTDVNERLAAADVFCFPSRWEGQGMALLEAAAAGVPIIASDLPVFHEAFDAASITFAPAGDPNKWAKTILNILRSSRLALNKAEKAKKIVQKKFDQKIMARTYADLYKTLL